MPSNKNSSFKKELLALLANTLTGLGMQEILTQLLAPPPTRSLQRFLTELIEERKIYRVGKGPSTKYLALKHDQATAQAEMVPLSQAGKELRALVSGPLAMRPPTTYHRDFLDSYVPNKTQYLKPAVREFLHHIGKINDTAQPIGTFGEEILHRLLIDLSWASSQLEGNTYSRIETQQLIDEGKIAINKDPFETQMILNHKDAINFLVENIENIDLHTLTLFNLHGLLSDGLLANASDSGKIRSQIVYISGTSYKPTNIPQVLSECFAQICTKAAAITDPFEKSFFLMVHLPYLQPFIDVNKRLSRLSANIPLLKNNLCPLAFIGMPQDLYAQSYLAIYELRDISLLQDVFVWAYERSAQEYLTVQQSMVLPDPIKLRYRRAIQTVLNSLVISCCLNPPEYIEKYALTHIPSEDRTDFQKRVLSELGELHEGVLARYHLSLEEYAQWQSRKRY